MLSLLVLLMGCDIIDKLAEELTEDPFDIDVVYVDWSPTPGQQAEIDAATALWENALVEGLVDNTLYTTQAQIDATPLAAFCQPINETVDDLLIWILVDEEMDGPVAIGKVCHLGYGESGLPQTGVIRLNPAFANGEDYADQFAEVIAHEMGHVIVYTNRAWNLDQDGDGISEWELIPGYEGDCATDSEVFYEGPAGVAAWHALGGQGGVPMEPGSFFQSESGCTHLSQEVFPTAMMGPHPTPSTQLGLDPITIGMMEDVGYAVDESQAVETPVNLGN